MTAVQINCLELCSIFIEKGVEINPQILFPDDSLLHAAVRSKNANMVQEFLNIGANKNIQLYYFKVTPLMLAVKVKNIDVLQVLLNSDADRTLCDADGNSVLHYAAQYADSPILQLLLNHEDVRQLMHSQNIYGYTPLDIAIQYKNDSAIVLFNPTEPLAIIQQSPNYGRIPIDINQTIILNNLKYYFILNYRNTELFPFKGGCNGLEARFQYFAERGMIEVTPAV